MQKERECENCGGGGGVQEVQVLKPTRNAWLKFTEMGAMQCYNVISHSVWCSRSEVRLHTSFQCSALKSGALVK